MNSVQFNHGVMRLSQFDPLSKEYHTLVLSLPEVPVFESLETLISCHNNKPLRMTKSLCSNTKKNNNNKVPRRCYSNPNISKQSISHPYLAPKPVRSKRSISSAFHAMTGFIVKANKKLRSQEPSVSWSTDTWLDELRSSSDYTSRASMTENWWKATPALR